MKINLKKLKEVKGPVTSEIADAMIEALEEAKRLIELRAKYAEHIAEVSNQTSHIREDERFFLERFEDE